MHACALVYMHMHGCGISILTCVFVSLSLFLTAWAVFQKFIKMAATGVFKIVQGHLPAFQRFLLKIVENDVSLCLEKTPQWETVKRNRWKQKTLNNFAG